MSLKYALNLFVLIVCVSNLQLINASDSSADIIVINRRGTIHNTRNRRELPAKNIDSFEDCGKIKRKSIDGRKFQSFFKDLFSGTVLERKRALRGEFPWNAALVMEQNGQMFYCGGALIDHWHLVSSAACVARMTPDDLGRLRVLLGSDNIYSKNESGRVEAHVSQVAYHKKFDSFSMENNIAVIKLQNPISYTKLIQPICISNGSTIRDHEQTLATVSGWGQLLFNPLKNLYKLDVRLWDNKRCMKTYNQNNDMGYFPEITNGSLCAGSPVPQSKSLCQGNNGSPLVIERNKRFELIGITSWGIGADLYPCVFTRVENNTVNWIQRSIEAF